MFCVSLFAVSCCAFVGFVLGVRVSCFPHFMCCVFLLVACAVRCFAFICSCVKIVFLFVLFVCLLIVACLYLVCCIMFDLCVVFVFCLFHVLLLACFLLVYGLRFIFCFVVYLIRVIVFACLWPVCVFRVCVWCLSVCCMRFVLYLV